MTWGDDSMLNTQLDQLENFLWGKKSDEESATTPKHR